MTQQSCNLIAAAVGALAGLAIVPHLPVGAMPASTIAALLVVCLSQIRHRRTVTLALCSVLGLACTATTMSLIA